MFGGSVYVCPDGSRANLPCLKGGGKANARCVGEGIFGQRSKPFLPANAVCVLDGAGQTKIRFLIDVDWRSDKIGVRFLACEKLKLFDYGRSDSGERLLCDRLFAEFNFQFTADKKGESANTIKRLTTQGEKC